MYPVLLLLLKQRELWLQKKEQWKSWNCKTALQLELFTCLLMTESLTSLTSMAGGLWSLKGWYVSQSCQNQMRFHTGLKKWLWYYNMHMLLSLGSYALEGFASSQKPTEFHKTYFRHRNLFTQKCSVQKIDTTDLEECIALTSFLFEKSDELYIYV